MTSARRLKQIVEQAVLDRQSLISTQAYFRHRSLGRIYWKLVLGPDKGVRAYRIGKRGQRQHLDQDQRNALLAIAWPEWPINDP